MDIRAVSKERKISTRREKDETQKNKEPVGSPYECVNGVLTIFHE